MGMRINLLPSAIANQIAAGEVIERPASVVKELLENSFDARADNITIEIAYGGLNQIKISDNGTGIVGEDLPLAVAAHATSKITNLDDLYAISSMGFRGEALASIASIAKVSISSRPAEQPHAMMLEVCGSEMNISTCARSIGTTINVGDLFFNAPVRKRFLKNEKIEYQAIEMVIKRFALSAPHIALTVKHNNKLTLSLPAALNEQSKQVRMLKIFGKLFINDAQFLDVEQGFMRLYGWISGPGFQRSQNDRQWVYINQRMVKDKLLNHAIKQAYDGLLHPGRFPACLLYFTLDTAEVDVNVHPTKHEVRFQQPRLIHDFFISQLSRALQHQKNNASSAAPGTSTSEHSKVSEPAPYSWTIASKDSSGKNKETIKTDIFEVDHAFKTVGREHSWINLNTQYSLIFFNNQPHVVDVIKLQNLWLNKQLESSVFPLAHRPLLVPVSYPLPVSWVTKEEQLADNLKLLGINVNFFKEHRVDVRTVPINLPYLDLRLLLTQINEFATLLTNTPIGNEEDDRQASLIHLLCTSQVFDARLLSLDEQNELNQLLVEWQNNHSETTMLYKLLSIEECRKLLNV
ncbi:MAG: DNA mismatch repair endonuclease MutL [bacterium]|nr:DNA mismatch repair endonuclease MutL [bacterium]